MPTEFHMHNDKPYCRVSHGNDRNTVSDVLATEAHKAKFPKEWDVFDEQNSMAAAAHTNAAAMAMRAEMQRAKDKTEKAVATEVTARKKRELVHKGLENANA